MSTVTPKKKTKDANGPRCNTELLAFSSNVCFTENEGKGALFCVGLDVPQQIYSLCLKLKRGSTPFTLTITRDMKEKEM